MSKHTLSPTHTHTHKRIFTQIDAKHTLPDKLNDSLFHYPPIPPAHTHRTHTHTHKHTYTHTHTHTRDFTWRLNMPHYLVHFTLRFALRFVDAKPDTMQFAYICSHSLEEQQLEST